MTLPKRGVGSSQRVDSPSGSAPPSPGPTLRALPGGVWALGFGSLLMDTSSELIHSLLPMFMVTTLGASMVTVGLIEGVAEATASIVKVFSGALSDYLGRRKALMVFGYALGALTKPVFPLAQSVFWVLAARFTDRIGKGIRGAPRDALVADITPASMRGAAYGLRQALDSLGALLGPSLAVMFMIWFRDDLRRAMGFAAVPAFATVVVLMLFVREPPRGEGGGASPKRVVFKEISRLPRGYWVIVLLGGVFTLARFSEAFLVLRAENVGLGLAYVPVVMVVMNVLYAGAAYPAGVAADRLSSRSLLFVGLLLLVAADLALAFAASPLPVFVGASLWGLHLAFTQGLFSKLVADIAPRELRGTGFGIFNLVSGVALLIASVVAGELWNAFGARATFVAGALFAAIAASGLMATPRHSADQARPA
jgi:MFS family permease